MNILNLSISPASEFIVMDLEYLADSNLYDRYRRADPRPAPCRWPFRRVVSASVMSVTVVEGIWEVTDFRSFAGPDDRRVVRQLFDWIIERPTHRVCTWSGAAEDLPILKTASMEMGFTLPRQLRQNERDRLGFCHLDLALILKGGSGQFVHMSELATRLGLPNKLAGSAGQVPHRVAENDFDSVAAISDCDTLTTSLLLASHLASLGQVSSSKAAHHATMRFVRERRERACYHRELGNYIARTGREMFSEQNRWLEAG